MDTNIRKVTSLCLAMLITLYLVLGFGVQKASAKGEKIAYIGETGYVSLKEAIGAAQDGDTIELIADDIVSLTDGSYIYKTNDNDITINGNGNTVYGKSLWNEAPSSIHGIVISGKGDVVINDLSLKNFGDKTTHNASIAPICAYTEFAGTLTLCNVSIEKFNRNAITASSGTIIVDDCNITCNATGISGNYEHLQQGMRILGTTSAIIRDTIISGYHADYPENGGSNGIGIRVWGSANAVIEDCILSHGDAVPENTYHDNANAVLNAGDGDVVIKGGSYSSDNNYAAFLSGNGTITIKGGTFTSESSYAVGMNKSSTGSFSCVGGVYSTPNVARSTVFVPDSMIDEEGREVPVAPLAIITRGDNSFAAIGHSVGEEIKEGDEVVVTKGVPASGNPDAERIFYTPENIKNVSVKNETGNQLSVNDLPIKDNTEINSDDATAAVDALDKMHEAAEKLEKVKKTRDLDKILEAAKAYDSAAKVADAAVEKIKSSVADEIVVAVTGGKKNAGEQLEKAQKDKNVAKYTPGKVALKSVASGNRSSTVTWKTIKNATGYQIRLTNTKNGKIKRVNVKQTKKLAKKKTIKKVVKKLSKKTKYRVQVRAYRTVRGKSYYGPWSNAKNVKTR